MRTLLEQAGFVDVSITIKDNAKEVIKDWIPGSGAENFVTSAYITATKPRSMWGVRDDVTKGTAHVELASVPDASAPAGGKVDSGAGC